MRRLFFAAALLLTSVAAPARAQTPSSPAAADSFRPLAAVAPAQLPAPLQRRLSVRFTDEPLAAVLDALARQSGVGVAYADDVARAPRVRLRADSLTVAELLVRATRGSGWRAWVGADGQVVVRRDAARPADRPVDRLDRVDRLARVSGTVRRLDSREIVRAATVAADSTRAGTNADGVFFLRVAPGPHTFRVRALGFQPLDTTVVVAAGSTTLELRLAPVAVALARTDVVASRERPDVDPRTPAMSVAKLDLATIRQTPAVFGEVDPIRSLTLLPGVSRSTDFSTAFSVRGGSNDQNLILLDEATIYNPAHVLGLLSVFNADAVDDVTLYKGALPARYGGRLSSVLDARQREGNANRLAGSASVGLLASRATVEGPLPAERGSFLVAGRRSYADLFLRFARDSALRESTVYFYDLNAKTSLRVGRGGTVVLSGYGGRDVFRPSSSFSASAGNLSGTLRWNQVVGGRLFSKVSLFRSDYDYRLLFKVVNDPVRWTSRIASRAVRVDEALALGVGQSIEFGVEGIAERVRPANVVAVDTSAALNPVDLGRRNGLTGAAYVDHQLDLGERFSLRYGARVSAFAQRGAATVYRYADDAPIVWSAAADRYEVRTPTDSTRYGAGRTVVRYGTVEPRLSFRVGLSPSSSVKASYARTSQYLLLASRTNTPTPLDLWEPVGTYLRPERGDQVAVGWAATFGGRWEVSAESYAKRLRNVVDFIDGSDVLLNPRLETAIVQGVGRAYGLELFARRTAGAVTGWVSYTLSRAEQRIAAPGGGGINDGRWYRAPTDKTHDLSVVALRPFGTRWTLGGVFALASGLPATLPVARYEVDGLLVAEYGARNGTRLPLYHRLDLTATRTAGRGELQFGVYNVYNRFNAQSLRFRQSQSDPRVTEAVQLAVFGAVPSVSYTRRF